jgi:membrane-associated protease RseP (regulator of RpoE activity)
MLWKVAILAIGAVAAAGATLLAMAPQSGGAKAGPPVVRLPPTGPFEIYADDVGLPGSVLGVTHDGRKIDAMVSPAGRSGPDLRMPLFGDPLVTPMPRSRPCYPFDQWTPGAARLGVVVQELTPKLSEYFGVKAGALVASVSPNSAASRAGLKAGDVITALNGTAVSGPEDVVLLILGVPDGQEVAIEIVRDKKPLTVKAKLAAARATRPT